MIDVPTKPIVSHVATAGDGVFSQLENDEIKLVDLKSNTTRVLMSTHDVRDVRFGHPYRDFRNLVSLPGERKSIAHHRLEIVR